MGREILDRVVSPADVRLWYGADPSHFADLRLPMGSDPHPLVVAVHGGFWRAAFSLAYMGHLCAVLAADGIATWNIEYRRLGQPGGGWPGTFQDAAAALDYLPHIAEQYSLDLARIVTVGHSAGGHLALWLAARGRLAPASPLATAAPLQVQGAVALGAVADLQMAHDLRLSNGVVQDLLGGGPGEMPERYAAASPRELLPLGVPQGLVHGTADEAVPYSISQAYTIAARAAGDRVRLVTLEGVDHFDPVDPLSAVWPVTHDAIVSLIRQV